MRKIHFQIIIIKLLLINYAHKAPNYSNSYETKNVIIKQIELCEIHSFMANLYIHWQTFFIHETFSYILYFKPRERMGNKVYRMKALLNRLKSIHLSLTAKQLNRYLGRMRGRFA